MNPRWELRRSVASAALLTQFAAEHGVTASDLLLDTGITPKLLNEATGEITGYQELKLTENLVERLGHVPGLGLLAGARYSASTHGIWGFALISSPTVRDAVNVISAYPELSYSFAVIGVETRPDTATMLFDDSQVPDHVRTFTSERDRAALLNAASEFVPFAIPALELWIATPEPSYATIYRDRFGVTPHFESHRNCVTIPAALLDLPLPKADPTVAALCTQQCATLLNRRRERLGTAGAVRDELLRTRRFTTDQDAVAAALNISVRTLRRRLADEGTSYREIVAETARMLAEELLSSGLTVSDVAHRLGYSGAPSFTDAFRQWKGTTPGAFALSRAQGPRF